jgi:hypothetical protein
VALAGPPGKQPAQAATRAAAADRENPAQDNSAFMDLDLTQRANPAGLDFVVTTDLWQGPKQRGIPGGPAYLKVQVFGADDPEGRGVPLSWFTSPPFTVTKGVRTGARYPFQIPLPPGTYLVQLDILGTMPMAWNRGGNTTQSPPVHASKRVRLRVG